MLHMLQMIYLSLNVTVYCFEVSEYPKTWINPNKSICVNFSLGNICYSVSTVKFWKGERDWSVLFCWFPGQLDLPLLTVTQCGTNLCVELQFPKLYKLNLSQYHQDMYNSSLKYKLNIRINGADVQMQERVSELFSCFGSKAQYF